MKKLMMAVSVCMVAVGATVAGTATSASFRETSRVMAASGGVLTSASYGGVGAAGQGQPVGALTSAGWEDLTGFMPTIYEVQTGPASDATIFMFR